jgi:CRISPR-associated protein Cmr1
MEPMEIKLKTLTPIWTGGADGNMDRLHETGIIGSLRWWYEAIVRGLGGTACDPTGDQRCPDKDGKRCVACELFGCTSWQRKFKLLILDENRNLFNIKPDEKNGLAKNTIMLWQFIELRSIDNEEKWLLYQAIRIASEYGAIGGRTPRKPQGNKTVGGDCGLFEIQNKLDIPQGVSKENVTQWLKAGGFRQTEPQEKWPDLRWFFFVQKQYLGRKKINDLLGLSEDGKRQISHADFQKALRGKVGISKKIFSFETPPGRMWVYLPNQELRENTISYLRRNLEIKAENIKTGEDVLNEL